MSLEQKPDERYDTLIGVILAFATAIGIWLYAVKPWYGNPSTTTKTSSELAAKTTANFVPSEGGASQTSTVSPEPTLSQVMITGAPSPMPTVTKAMNPPLATPPVLAMPATAAPVTPPVVPVTPVTVITEPPMPVATPVITQPPVTVVMTAPPMPVSTPEVIAPTVTAVPVTPEPTAIAVPVPSEPTAALPENVVVRESIEFAMGKAAVPESAKQRLLEVAALLKNDARQLKIVGHTDNIGFTGANRRLSLRRAQSVKAFLVNAGVDAQHLSVEGLGEREPIDDNQTDAGRRRNRRIEILQ